MLISVIIPAFNCAETLCAAVESAVTDFSDLEILIIDDGSEDTTPTVISSLKEKYACIRSIRTANGGPANARNTGIENACGDYIMFIDSDDAFESDIYRAVIPILKDEPDMVIFGFRQHFAGLAEDKIYSLNEPFTVDAYYKNNLLNQVWNKVYKREFLIRHHILFSDYKYGEDRLFNADALRHSPTVATLPDILYRYNIDKSVSLISGYEPKKFDACKEIYKQFSALCNQQDTVLYMFLKNILSCMTVLYADNCKLSKKEREAEVKRIITDKTVRETMTNRQVGTANELIRRIIKTENTRLNLILAKGIALCQKRFLSLFLKFRG